MSHHRWHVIEKIQVEVAAAVALAGMYFLIWPMLGLMDVDRAFVCLPTGSWARLAAVGVSVCVLAGVSALLTVSARPEGALLATLIGAGGASLHSAPMRLLLMRHERNLSALLVPLAGELLIMVIIVCAAMIVIQWVRQVVRRFRPGWVWPETAPGQQALPGSPPWSTKPAWQRTVLLAIVDRRFARGAAGPGKGEGTSSDSGGEAAISAVAACGLTLLIGLLLLIVTLSRTDTGRGQILFALAFSFLAAGALACHFFPVGVSTPCWIAPIVLGALFYLKSSGVPYVGVITWTNVDAWGHILPIDWLSAGCGGAVGGYWISRRLGDLRRLRDAEGEAAGKNQGR